MGMESFHNRMADSITENPNPGDKLLATRLFQCVTCSLRRLALVELLEALGGITDELLAPSRTIISLCGDFIVVDGGCNIAMIHQTTRDSTTCSEIKLSLNISKLIREPLTSTCSRVACHA